jgi:hypothetical protein
MFEKQERKLYSLLYSARMSWVLRCGTSLSGIQRGTKEMLPPSRWSISRGQTRKFDIHLLRVCSAEHGGARS